MQCSDTSLVWCAMCQGLCCTFLGEYNSGRILKIGQHFSKLWTNAVAQFFWHTVYIGDWVLAAADWWHLCNPCCDLDLWPLDLQLFTVHRMSRVQPLHKIWAKWNNQRRSCWWFSTLSTSNFKGCNFVYGLDLTGASTELCQIWWIQRTIKTDILLPFEIRPP